MIDSSGDVPYKTANISPYLRWILESMQEATHLDETVLSALNSLITPPNEWNKYDLEELARWDYASDIDLMKFEDGLE